MNIVIFTGGTGSIALQSGLYRTLDKHIEGVDTKVIVNAYDNGLSTGTVRTVMAGEILGPSDVRKNHATRLKLIKPESPWLNCLNLRFSAERLQARAFCEATVSQLYYELHSKGLPTDGIEVLLHSIDEYFSVPMATQVDYRQFSFANIVYAGLAHTHNNSLRSASSLLARSMGIPDIVLLNDDRSLFLGAITRAGERVTDEERIVSWGNESDPFIDVFFTDVNGNDTTPVLCLEAWDAIVRADLIILSSGTQWSSLIPTYASDGFKRAINESKADVLMVMNRTPDRDSPGQSASDIIDALVPRYFDTGRVHVLADRNGHESMRALEPSSLTKVSSFEALDLSVANTPNGKHDPDLLSRAIGQVYFRQFIGSDYYLFDYDDTLVGRFDQYVKSSHFNMSGISALNHLADVGICTGNTIEALAFPWDATLTSEHTQAFRKSLQVFADGGVNRYCCGLTEDSSDRSAYRDFIECVCPETLLNPDTALSAAEIIAKLERVGIPRTQIHNRGNVIVAIKPVDLALRPAFISLVKHVLRGSALEVRETGRTTVEICHPNVNKLKAVRYISDRHPVSKMTITYVGDECDHGNDRSIRELSDRNTGVKCLRVRSPAKTAFFISTLLSHLEQHGRR